MIIKSIKIKGFKGFKNEFYTNFNDKITVIEGENFQGKTSIGEAICWAFLGTNLWGNDKTINIINNYCNTACIIIEFIDNEGKQHTIIRSKGKENIVVLDGKKANVEMLSKFYYSKKVFLSIFNPYYFSNLEPKEQRELLKSVLPTINYRDAFNLLSQSEREILVEPRLDLNEFIKNSRLELKELEKEKSNFEGRQQYANSIVMSHIEEERKFEQEGLLTNLQREYEITLKSIEGDTKKEMKLRIDELDKKIQKHEKLIENLRKDYKDNQKIIDDIKQNNSLCPICGSKLSNDIKLTKIIEKQTKKIDEIIKQGKEIEIELKNLRAQRSMLDIKCNMFNKNEKKEAILTEIQEKISRLKLEKEDIQKTNYEIKVKRKAIEKAKNDIDVINKGLEEIKSTQIILNNQISTATSLNNLIIKKQMEMVSEYLDKVRLEFSKIDKTTGEIKDDYKIFYDNKEFNVLSLSEKIRATLEISNLINNIVGLNLPTFIDNSESITHYNKEFDNQVILAKVAEKQELKLIV